MQNEVYTLDVIARLGMSEGLHVCAATTLLMPGGFDRLLRRQLANSGYSLHLLLKHLIREHKEELVVAARGRRELGLVRYQSPGQKLQRLHLRPDPRDWLELGQLAMMLGISKSYAFVCLLKLSHLAALMKDVGAPTRRWWIPRQGIWNRERITLTQEFSYSKRECRLTWRRRIDTQIY